MTKSKPTLNEVIGERGVLSVEQSVVFGVHSINHPLDREFGVRPLLGRMFQLSAQRLII